MSLVSSKQSRDDFIETDGGTYGPTPANARLIALAPDLARLCAELGEALEAILEHNPPEVVKDDFAYDRLKEAYRDCARAALAKFSKLNNGADEPPARERT